MVHRLIIATALAGLSLATSVSAQTFPSRTVTFMVTAAPGGITDILARAVGQRLSEK